MPSFVTSKLTRCRLLALLSALPLGFIVVFVGSLIAQATVPLIQTMNPSGLIALRLGIVWVLATLLTCGLAAILGPYDLLVIATCVVPALLYFGANYAMNVYMYLPDNGHTMYDIAGGVPPFYFWGHFLILSTALVWSLATAGAGIALKRSLMRPKAGAMSAKLSPAETRRLRNGLIFDVGFLFLVTFIVLAIDLEQRFRLGEPDVIVSNVTRVLESPTSSSNDRLNALSNLEQYSDKFHGDDLRNAIEMLHHATREQSAPVNLAAAAILIDFHDLSGLPLIADSLLSSPQHGVPSPNIGLWTNLAGHLERINDPAAIPTLAHLMTSPDPETRRGAVQGLRNIHSPETIDPLILGLYDTDGQVQFSSMCGLIMLLANNKSEYGWERPSHHFVSRQDDLDSLKAWAKERDPGKIPP